MAYWGQFEVDEVVLSGNPDGLTTISSGTAGWVLTSNGTAAPEFKPPAGSGGGIAWQNQATSITVTEGAGYLSTAAITLTLPAAPTNGAQIGFIASTAGTLIVQANTGQVIQVNAQSSTSAGTATNTAVGDSLYLVYQSSTQKWFSFSTGGNWNTA